MLMIGFLFRKQDFVVESRVYDLYGIWSGEERKRKGRSGETVEGANTRLPEKAPLSTKASTKDPFT